jgi:acyl-CoA thioester hydrolase
VSGPHPPVLTCHRLSVRFSDCDLLGHVNNAVYLSYLEQARIDLWRRQLGFLSEPEGKPGPRGPAFILARAEVDFRAQARYADELEVRMSLGRFGRTSLGYDYEVVNVATGVVVVRAKTVQVWFDYETNTPVPISDELKARLATPVT